MRTRAGHSFFLTREIAWLFSLEWQRLRNENEAQDVKNIPDFSTGGRKLQKSFLRGREIEQKRHDGFVIFGCKPSAE
jgi:hypothetical protein